MEVWKLIPGYGDKYEVSSRGSVRSMDLRSVDSRNRPRFRSGRVLSQTTGKNGYLYITFSWGGYKNNKIKTCTVHRLVAAAFILNPLDKPCVNHIDGNKNNNDIINLEWVTYKENAKHALSNDLRHSFKISRDDLYMLYITKDMSVYEISKMFNRSTGCIYQSLKHHGIKTKRYIGIESYKSDIDKMVYMRNVLKYKIKDIANIFNRDQSTISKIITKENIQ